MPSFIVLFLALSFVSSTAVAQTTPQTPSRWTLSAGREWSRTPNLWGLRLRADYDLVGQHSPVRLQLQMGTLWGPTQFFFHSFGSPGYTTSYMGSDQTIDLTFGVVAAITPVPRARVAPYFTFGVLARQSWSYGWSRWSSSVVGGTFETPERLRALGAISAVPGLGVRARIGQRTYQFEYRWLANRHSATFGTRLPFE